RPRGAAGIRFPRRPGERDRRRRPREPGLPGTVSAGRLGEDHPGAVGGLVLSPTSPRRARAGGLPRPAWTLVKTGGHNMARNKLVPPLKWHGGKHYVAPKVLELMPRPLHYVEPFFGGGQVLFRRDPADPRYWWDGPTSDGRKADGVSEVVNDLDGDLMNFYRVLKDPALFDRLHEWL